MNNKGITYFRLNSPYDCDITKNCALDGYEVDNNFLVLEGRDVQSVYVEGDRIKVRLINGDVIASDEVFDEFTKELSFRFDTENGILYITRNGVETKIEGFVTEFSDDKSVASDNTLSGNGKPSDPLSISKLYRTGQYKPVKKFIDKVKGENLPSESEALVGDRYVVLDATSDYGLLYDYDGVKRIACDLVGSNSEWRIPTKEDWDDMLNAIEPCDEDKDHGSASCNRYLGRYAGKLLKSVDGWRKVGCSDASSNTCINYDTTGCGCTCGKNIECSPMYCGEYNSCCCKPHDDSTAGVDAYGFRALPAGYADDGGNVSYFGDRAYFWTATNANCGNSAFMKRLEYSKATVYQDVISSKNSLSLRLVKDYTGSNYYEKEEILGVDVPAILMPSVKKGHAVWTEVNIAFADKLYNGIVPNLGFNITTTNKYYIYEWDGNKWLINALNEGENVVIFDGPNEEYAYEYQVIKGDLVSVSGRIIDIVYEKVSEDLTNLDNKITAETERATAKENEISETLSNVSDKLDEEIQNRTEAENIINQKIADEAEARENADNTEKTEREAADSAIRTDLATVNQNLVDSVNTINQNMANGFNTINTNVANAITTINDAIEAERTIRTDKDAEIDGKIEELVAKDAELEQEIADEKTAREEADTTEKTEREAADTAEKEAREAKDTELEEKIDANKEETDAAIEAEKTAREEKDAEIEGKLLTEEGTGFDETTGIITLKSNDGSNDIQIQLVLNMGTI